MLAIHERLRSPHTASDIFVAELRPCHALGDDAFETAVAMMLALSILGSVVANQLGVWPIGVAVGLTGLLTASAFVVWRGSLDRMEEIRLCDNALCVRRFRKGRLVDQRRFGLERTRLIRRDDPDYGCLGLCLQRDGSRFCIAADLPPSERDRFALSLAAAAAAQGLALPVVSIPRL